MRVLVIIPTYDERESLPTTVRRLRAAVPAADALVVDDASPDGTGELADRLAAADPAVHVLHRPERTGLGGAYIAGFDWAREHGHDVVVEMDADLSHRPEELPRLLRAAREHDLVIGSRYVPGGAVRNWGRFRRLLSRGGNAYARAVLAVPLADATSGYRAYRREVLEEITGRGIGSEGYAFQIELAYRAWRGGWSVAEVPITFREREHGRSKMSRRIVFEAVWNVASWGVRDRLRRRDARPD